MALQWLPVLAPRNDWCWFLGRWRGIEIARAAHGVQPVRLDRCGR